MPLEWVAPIARSCKDQRGVPRPGPDDSTYEATSRKADERLRIAYGVLGLVPGVERA